MRRSMFSFSAVSPDHMIKTAMIRPAIPSMGSAVCGAAISVNMVRAVMSISA